MSQLPTENPVAFRRALSRWFNANARSLPWRENRSPYYVVVSELMLQQTQVKTVLPYYDCWMQALPDWSALADAPEDQVLKLWEGLGYYSRARNLHKLAKTVVSDFDGAFPSDPEVMKTLPGIGPYTAGAVASLAFGKSVPLIDGNVERVFARFFNICSDIKLPANQKKLWSLAEELIPQKNAGAFNESLMELGALICTPKSPQCLICPVKNWCTSQTPETLPVRIRAKTIKLNLSYAVIIKGKKIWLMDPSEPGRWKGFHRLPEYDPQKMEPGKAAGIHTFGITKYRITATVQKTSWKKSTTENAQWHPLAALTALALPVPIRKMVQLTIDS